MRASFRVVTAIRSSYVRTCLETRQRRRRRSAIVYVLSRGRLWLRNGMRTPSSTRSSRKRLANAPWVFTGGRRNDISKVRLLHSLDIRLDVFSHADFTSAHNLQLEDEHTIDVHRLKPTEATRRTEIAIRDALVAGATRLRVICGRGNHSRNKLPVLKLALIAAMEQYVVYPLPTASWLTFELKEQDRHRGGSR